MSEATKVDISEIEKRSVIEPPLNLGTAIPSGGGGEALTLWFVSQFANAIIPWGRATKQRDAQLRAFIPLENIFASALGIIASRNSGFSWKLDGPTRTVSYFQDVFDNANEGAGWHDFTTKLTIDLSSQDNGAWIEIVRDTPESRIYGVNHLDSSRCWPTGLWQTPCVYKDWKGRLHLLKWFQVAHLLDMPSPMENIGFYGTQYSTLTRILMKMQMRQNLQQFDYEKTSGRSSKAIHLVKGITTQQIKDAVADVAAQADSAGMTRYTAPILVGTVSPEADVGHDTIMLQDVPEGWSPDIDFNQYINLIAMGFMTDYQEFAPLPGQRLGTGAQSEVLHLKARGKGPGTWMSMITRAMNSKVLPKNARFFFDEQDLEAEKTVAEVKALRAQTRAVRIKSGEITPEAARQIANDEGDLPYEYLQLMREQDVTPNVTVSDDDPAPAPGNVKPGTPGPTTAPAGGGGGATLRSTGGSAVRSSRPPSSNPPAPLGNKLRPTPKIT
jgi:hypothetical protein